ncbi:hypothetical protein MTR67_002042 [Solanum verrucosum]|uniref:Uncharacterized protein n=1 Tax=Solanum verrucosum TaxID=315347 RepID=A0AAF0PQ95_SOLVR|nr:hypothetical protein MTR67_002042 [Solanum verrucosum]
MDILIDRFHQYGLWCTGGSASPLALSIEKILLGAPLPNGPFGVPIVYIARTTLTLFKKELKQLFTPPFARSTIWKRKDSKLSGDDSFEAALYTAINSDIEAALQVTSIFSALQFTSFSSQKA